MQDPIRSGWILFQKQNFFEAHDQWEEAWQQMTGHRRVFWQAMIQLAVSAYHVQTDNYSGAISQARKAREKFLSVPVLSGREDVKYMASLTGDWLQILDRRSKADADAFMDTHFHQLPETILAI